MLLCAEDRSGRLLLANTAYDWEGEFHSRRALTSYGATFPEPNSLDQLSP